MDSQNFDTLSQAVNALTRKGYEEGFKAEDNAIVGSISSKRYLPEDLKIVGTHRFEGMTNPQDDCVVFAIEANDGNKGTLVMSYSSQHNQNVELIRRIPKVNT
ncbi:MAG: phosphoribosylpyrophosphate synthetase [Cryomorphaceae bacterium]